MSEITEQERLTQCETKIEQLFEQMQTQNGVQANINERMANAMIKLGNGLEQCLNICKQLINKR